MTFVEQAEVVVRAFEAGAFEDLVDRRGVDGDRYHDLTGDLRRRVDELLGEGLDVRAVVNVVARVPYRAADLFRELIR